MIQQGKGAQLVGGRLKSGSEASRLSEHFNWESQGRPVILRTPPSLPRIPSPLHEQAGDAENLLPVDCTVVRSKPE